MEIWRNLKGGSVMREGSGMGSFILGIGVGAIAGIAVNRWLENNGKEPKNDHQQEFKLDRQEIAQLADQFLSEGATPKTEG